MLVALVTMCAIAVDLSALRTDRRADKLAADAASAAGVSKLDTSPTGRYNACTEAWDYAARNLGYGANSAVMGQDATVCAPFQSGSSCSDSSSPPASSPGGDSVTGSFGRYALTITTPVEDSNALMAKADDIGGGLSQGISTTGETDGAPCERLGITLAYTRAPIFAGVTGAGPAMTTLHSVALMGTGGQPVVASVVILDPTDCNVLVQNSASGGIIVSDSTGTRTAAAVVVSNATATSGAGKCTQLSTNNDYEVEAKGNGTGNGIIVKPGDMYLGAYGGSSCGSTHACNQGQISSGGTPSNISIQETLTGPYVQPQPLSAPVDRTLVDYRFNCKSSYASTNTPTAYNPPRSTTVLGGCTTAGGTDFVNQYVGGVQSGDLLGGNPSTVLACGSVPSTISAPANSYLDFKCTTSGFPNNFNLAVTGDALFESSSLAPGTVSVTGNAVINGGVSLNNGSSLRVGGNARLGGAVTLSGGALAVCSLSSGSCQSSPPAGTSYASNYFPACSGTGYTSNLPTCVHASGSDFHTVYLDTGFSLKQTGTSTLELDHTFAYEVGSTLTLGGGGSITWSPPDVGPFAQPNSVGGTSKLSLWSDGVGSGLVGGPATQVQSLSGGGTISMSGVFFTPGQCWQLTGTNDVGTTGTLETQFIAYCMEQDGNSHFQLTPEVDLVPVVLARGPVLIR
jgi:hypothetical protein